MTLRGVTTLGTQSGIRGSFGRETPSSEQILPVRGGLCIKNHLKASKRLVAGGALSRQGVLTARFKCVGRVGHRLTISEDDLLRLARQAHSKWLEMMESRGYHPTSFCGSFGKGCPKCNPDMVPFDDLPGEVREAQISCIRAIEESLGELGYLIYAPKPSESPKLPWPPVREIELTQGPGGDAVSELRRTISTYRRP